VEATNTTEPTSTTEPNRRDFLFLATGAMGAVGLAGFAWPFINSMSMDAGSRAVGAPIEIDLAPIAEGQSITLKWRGNPIFVRHRTAQEVASAKADDPKITIDPQPDSARVGTFNGQKQERWIVVQGSCTHLGCVPIKNSGDYNGWYCPCHGSHYDNAGRVRKGPAPKNLIVPVFEFVSETKVRITNTNSLG